MQLIMCGSLQISTQLRCKRIEQSFQSDELLYKRHLEADVEKVSRAVQNCSELFSAFQSCSKVFRGVQSLIQNEETSKVARRSK